MKSTIIVKQSPAIALIDNERRRQQLEEGFTTESDIAINANGELALAAACYALPNMPNEREIIWPWLGGWWKPSPNDRKREIIKAGALLVAEWDRLDAIERT